MKRRPAWLTALLLVLFVVLPVAEIWVLVLVAHQIGVLATLGIVVGTSLFGAWMVKREGGKAWTALRGAVGEGKLPQREVTDGALVLAGGILMVLPGFITDVVGLLLMLPFTRGLGRALLGVITARKLGGVIGSMGGAGTVIKGSVVEDAAPPAEPVERPAIGRVETEDFTIDPDGTIRPK